MEVVVGTYEELLLGYSLDSNSVGCELIRSFSDHTHTGCVKAVAISGSGMLAAGSTDERISLFSLKKKKEVGTLMHHDGSLTCLAFHDKKHMFSASEDGTIGIWQTGNWECLRTLRGHKEAVYWVSVHPTGKLALSVGKDKTLRTWNLITGRPAYVTNLKEAAEVVCWCPSGDIYALVYSNRIDLYKIETSEIFYTFKSEFRVQTICFLRPGILAIGGDGGKVQILDTNTQLTLLDINTETNRVKAMCGCCCPNDPDRLWVTTGSSDGFIKVWEITETSGIWSFEKVAEVDTNFRIVSLAVRPQHTKSQESPQNLVKVKEETPTATIIVEDPEEKDQVPPMKRIKEEVKVEADTPKVTPRKGSKKQLPTGNADKKSKKKKRKGSSQQKQKQKAA